MVESLTAGTMSELTIVRLGARGDGIAETAGGPVYVAYALPNERVRVAVDGSRGMLAEVIEPSREREAPVCRHFTVCGGCATQHMARAAERDWKAQLVRTAFSQQRIDAPMRPMMASEPGTRRRAVFAARRAGSGGVVFGFHAPSEHRIVDLAECPVLSPAISGRLSGLRALAGVLLSRSGEARLTVTEADNGIDVAVADGKPLLTMDDRAAIPGLARAARIIRLSIGGETVFESVQPLLKFGLADVALPPGVFLQAVPAAEARMTGLIVAACGKAKRVADLFSGAGTFSFALAVRAQVLAVDSDKAAIGALQEAARRTQGIKPMTSKVRDLLLEPLSAKELEGFDAVVFDPPRAGADAQAHAVARSKVKTVIAVSCAPGTLARDVRTLIDGGYELESVTPVDQFVFSAHVEAIAVLRRPRTK